MRLRLNTKLRAALIAAITAVGFTLSQASAADQTLANIMNTQTNTTVWGDTGLNLTSSATCTTEGVKNNTAYTQSIRAIDINIGANPSNNYTYTLNFTTETLAQAVTLSSINVDFATFNGNGQGHNEPTANKINCAWTLTDVTDGSLVADDSLVVDLPANGKATSSAAVYTKNADNTYTTNGFTGGTAKIDFDDFELQSNKTYTLTLTVSKNAGAAGFFVGIGNIALINTIPTPISTWNGTSENHTWSDAASWKNDEAFKPGSIAVFDNTANHQTVTITTAETAESITVDGAAYIFEGSGSVTAGTLSFTNDGSLSLDTTLDLGNTTDLAELSKVTVTQNGTLKVVAGSKSVINLNAASTGTLEIKSGSVSNTCAIGTSAATLKLDSGTALCFDNKGNHELNYNLALGGDATVEVYGSTYHPNGVTISGNVSGSGHKLTKNDVGNLDFTGNVELGTLLLNSNSKVTLSGSSSQLASAEVNDGTLQINSATTISDKLYGKKGTITVGDDTHNVVVKTARVELGDYNPAATSTLNVAANSVLWVTSSSPETGYKAAGLVLGEWSTPTTVNLMGTLIADQVSATAGDSGYVMNINGGTALLKGLQRKEGNRKQEINVTSDGRLILGENGIVGANTGSNVTLTVNDGTIGIYADSVTIDKAITVSGATTFDTQKYTVNEAVIAQGETGGVLTVSGNLTGDGTITKAGEGTLELSGTANVLTHTIAANAGTLKLSGSFEIGDITPTGGEIRYDDGQRTGNGYETASGKVVVYSGEGAVETTGGTFTYRGKGVEIVEGAYTTSGQQDTTTYYINNDTDSYNWIDTHKKAALTGGIVVKANATLEVDKNMDLSLVATSSAGTVMIDSGYVVNAADGRKVTLAGEGTYALAEGAKSLGSDIVLGDNWTGIVRLTAADQNNIDLSQFVKGTSSTIELKGFNGWTGNNLWKGINTENIKLTNNGQTVAWSCNAYSMASTDTATFTGKISGEGTFQADIIASRYLNYTYTGNISDWSGKFEKIGAGTTNLTFAGSATAVNAEIAKNGGTLNVVVDNNATFSKTVTADSLTVNATKSATFNGTATFDSVNGTGKVVVGEDSTLTVSGTVGSDVAIDAADGATIDAAIAASRTGINEGAKVSFVNGVSDDASGVSFQNGGDNAVTVENTGAGKLYYGIGEEAAKVTADSLNGSAQADVMVKNEVVVGEIVNYGEGCLTLTNVDTAALQSIGAFMGDITLQNVGQEPIELKDMSLLTTTVAVYQGTEEAATEGTVTITDALFAAGSTLLANLTIIANEQGTTAWTLMNAAMTLGSALTLDTERGSRLIQLDEATMTAIAAMTDGQEKALVLNGADAITYEGGDWWDNVFSRNYGEGLTLTGDYKVGILSDGNWGVTKFSNVPEPTTGTLSLLALAALAARRRRK